MRSFLRILFLLLIVAGIYHSELVGYGLKQGRGQLEILMEAKPLGQYLDDPSYPDSLKVKIKLIQEIKAYAIDSIGLNESDSYQKMYDQKGKPVLWVVTAAPKFKLEAYKWSFPFLGDLSYKGFFKQQLAKDEKQRLDGLGYDTDIDVVGAWSTLGWFSDPILSNMLSKSSGGLARLIIHELTHGSIFVSGNTELSENIATFVGDNGAIQFLTYKYGNNSKELKKFVEADKDRKSFTRYIKRASEKLNGLYNDKSFINSDSISKTRQKEACIDQILTNLDTLSLNQPNSYGYLKKAKYRPNNTYFISFLNYHSKQTEFELEFNEIYGKDFAKYLQVLKERY